MDALVPVAFGAKEFAKCYAYFARAQALTLLYAPFIAIVLCTCIEPFLINCLGQSYDTARYAAGYCRGQCFGLIAYALADCCRKFLSCVGEAGRLQGIQAMVV